MQLSRVSGSIFVIAAALISASAIANGAGEPVVPTLTWADCGGGFQCASATVPLDYDKPRTRTIDIALIRRPALDQANRIGSLFANPGGPGLSGVDFVRETPPPAFQLLARFDIVGFDPRGRGASRPAVLDCGRDPSYAIPMPRPTATDEKTFLTQALDFTRKCRSLNGDILPHLSTANVARDVDLLRAAVGDDRLNYIGQSYGAVIGATYASLFPGRTRAMVLDSPIDVQGYYGNPIRQWREHAAGLEQTLDRFLNACAGSRGACRFGDGNPAAALERLLERLDRQPAPSSDPADHRTVSGDLVRRVLEDALRTRARWPALAAALAEVVAGDGRSMLHLADRIPGGVEADDFTVAVLAVDQRYRHRPVLEYFKLAERSYNEFPHFWFLSGYWDLVRAVWPVEDRDAFRGRIRNPRDAAPILIIGMTHDPATPFVQAQRLTADLGNARLLTFEADGHGAATTFDPCVLDAVVRYMSDGALPPEGSVCVQQGEAFPQVGE